VAAALHGIAARLPDGLAARVAEDADLERIVEFQNRYATTVHWQSPVAAREFARLNPEPNRLAIVVEHHSEIVAAAQAGDGGIWASPDRSWRVGLRVAPEWRRQGIASTILEPLETHARERRASRLVSSIRGTEPEGVAFATTRGFREFHRRIDSYIDVAAFDGSRFEDPDDVARRIGVRFLSYSELTRERAADLEPLQRALIEAFWEWARDVPSPVPMPAQPPPFEQARRMFFEGPGMDPESTILAMRGDAPVGVTATMVKENGVAYTNFTGVSRAERGKGIALALKLRALRELRRRSVRLFGTTNDEQNAAMRGINSRLGYVPEPPTIMVEKAFA
jgi:GNAT superfamily N-acetyltransferase